MSLLRSFALPVLTGALLVSGCGNQAASDDKTKSDDPALSGALGDQIMVDPDLANQNKGDSAMTANGPPSATLPPVDKSPEAIAAARADALKLAGGSIRSVPAAVTAQSANPAATTPAELAAQTRGTGANCADKAEYSAAWAARLPGALTVYPRANVVEAAGTDRDGCRLRVVHFLTPVPARDVLDFYYTRVRAAGYDAEHRSEGKDSVLGGSKDTAAYVLYVRKLPNGLTEVDLIANGG
ncbi:MAG: hypothetical protein WCY11_02200 [Novosphingobium sp.]